MAVEDDVIVGFVLVESRYPQAAEITSAAVRHERRRAGVGTALADRAMTELCKTGTVLIEVKTLDASAGYAPYDSTRRFWARHGFQQIDCVDPLPGWDPGNPSAIFVAALRPTR